MMSDQKFDYSKYAKLDHPDRKKILPIDQLLSPLEDLTGDLEIADIGCGTGYLSIPMAEKVGERSTIYAIDLNEEMLGILEERSEHLSNIQRIQSGENKIPIPSNTVDISFMINVFHELENPELFIQEIQRFSKSDHRVVIVDWTDRERKVGPPPHKAVSEAKVIQIMQNSGYNLIEEFMDREIMYGLTFRMID